MVCKWNSKRSREGTALTYKGFEQALVKLCGATNETLESLNPNARVRQLHSAHLTV